MKAKVLLAVVGLLALASMAMAGPYEISIAQVQGLWAPDTALAGKDLRFILRVRNDSFNFALSNGFRLYSPDGATWDSTKGDTLGWRPGDPSPGAAILGKGSFDIQYNINYFSNDGDASDTVGFIAAKIASPGLAPGFNDTAWAVTAFKLSKQSHQKHICIDSTWFPPGGAWKWVAPGGISRFPTWSGEQCFVIIDTGYVEASVSPDTLHFSALVGANPPNQTFQVNATKPGQSFTLIEGSSWISKSPVTGTTPRTITVTINTTGLLAGVYLDSIEVDMPNAGNSPIYEYIELTLSSPAAQIAVNPSQFFFNSILGGPNPPPDTLVITNPVFGATLNWTVTNSQSWLSLSPLLGTDNGEVVLNVDISSVGIGTFYDTIVVEDFEASNSPVKVPVRLVVASDLPVIVVDSLTNYVVCPAPGPTFSRTINITNGGGGILDFTATESSPRLAAVTPGSGTAPQSVQVDIDITGLVAGDYYDTVLISSSSAVNSPVAVEFRLHVVANPAVIVCNRDTISFSTVECFNGADAGVPDQVFFATNGGGDNPMNLAINYSSVFFSVTPSGGNAPTQFFVKGLNPSVPVGVYYDSILIQAANAINSPRIIIVKYTKIDPPLPPTIALEKSSFIVPRQEDAGLIHISSHVTNAVAGCMPWSYTEDVDFFLPLLTSGDVRENLTGYLDPTGLTLGTYIDTFYVTATGATNSPKPVHLELRIWRFHGDYNWDGIIDLADLMYAVDFVFFDGPIALPEYRVGDTNCDGFIDIADITVLVDYLFLLGPIPCGNPY